MILMMQMILMMMMMMMKGFIGDLDQVVQHLKQEEDEVVVCRV